MYNFTSKHESYICCYKKVCFKLQTEQMQRVILSLGTGLKGFFVNSFMLTAEKQAV